MFVVSFVDPKNKKSSYIFQETKEGRQEALKCIIRFMSNIISKNISDGCYKDEDEKMDEKFYNRKIKEELELFEDDDYESYLMEKIEKEYFTIQFDFVINLSPLINAEKLIIKKPQIEQNIEPRIEG